MFMRKIGIAAALMLCAFGASASNFRGADQVYVPVAGHAGGSSGLFISDAYIANLTGDVVDVAVIYVPRNPNAGGSAPAGLEEIRNRITLQPFERKEFPDIFVNTLGKESGFGLLIFNGCKSGEDCGVGKQDDFGDSINYRAISVQTRIYQIQPLRPDETTGQLFAGIPWYHFVSKLQNTVGLDKVFITGLTQTGTAGQAGTYRSNIGVVNASEYTRTNLVIRLWQGGMNEATNLKATATVALGPLGSQLYGFSDLFPGFTGSNYFVTVEQTGVEKLDSAPQGCLEGCPAFLAYGSVLDNKSGDALTLEAQYMIELDEDIVNDLYPPSSGKRTMRRSARH
jgi:hypothetical protein